MLNSSKQTIWNAATPVAITSSTDATPIVVTATAHGFVTGDTVMIYGHTTNVAANGIFKVTKVTADTFSLQGRFSGADVAGSGAGAGSGGLVIKAPAVLFIEQDETVTLQVDTASSGNMTLLVAGSLGKAGEDTDPHYGDVPNFGATQSKSAPWSAVAVVDLADDSTVPGATGIVAAGTDIHKLYEVNANALKYLTLIPSAWSAGSVSVTAFITKIG